MSRHTKVLATLVVITGLALTVGGIYAVLSADAFNTSAQDVDSGTLTLVMADNGDGFSQSVGPMAPGDVVNRFVDVTSGGTLDGKDLVMSATDATPSLLTTDGTNGLHVSVVSCTQAWDPVAGTCGGTSSPVATDVALADIPTASPATLASGSVTSGTVFHYKVSLTLPDQAETTLNGVLPANTIQGLSASLTWTFTLTQRTATTTNS